MSADRSLRRREVAYHAARISLCLVAFGIARHVDSDVLAALASAGFVLASFSLGHDAAHGVLGLPRRVNAALLAAAYLPILVSGHGVKATHAKHHRAPLSDGDAEGRAARRSLLGALLWAPVDAWNVRLAGFRLAPRRERPLVLVENVASVGLAGALALSEAGRIHLVVALALQMSLGLWASFIPHHVPAWLDAIARPLANGPSIVARSLVFHEVHHARPDVPSAWLGRIAPVAAAASLALGGCQSAEARDPNANRAVASDVAGIHAAILDRNLDAMNALVERGHAREARALASARELPLARALRARFGADLVDEAHVKIEQSEYRAGVLLEGRYVVRVALPISHDDDGGSVGPAGPASIAVVELAEVCVMRDCPDANAEPDDDRLSIRIGSVVELSAAQLLAPGATLATWLGRAPVVGSPVLHGDEAMRAEAGLYPPSGR